MFFEMKRIGDDEIWVGFKFYCLNVIDIVGNLSVCCIV